MGLTWVEAVIKNPNTDRHATAKALIDTAATLTVLPRRIAEELQLPTIGRGSTAKGAVELDEYVGVVEVMGRYEYLWVDEPPPERNPEIGVGRNVAWQTPLHREAVRRALRET